MAASRATSRTATIIDELEGSMSTDKLRFYMVIGSCALVIITALVGYISYSKNKEKEEKARMAAAEADTAIERVRNVASKEPENYSKIKQTAEEAMSGPLASGFEALKGEASRIKDAAVAAEAAAKTRKENLDLLAEIQKEVEDPAKRATLRLKIDKAAAIARGMGKEYEDEVKKVDDKLLLLTLNDYVVEAKAKEATSDTAGAFEAYDKAVAAFTKQFDRKKPSPEVVALYKDLIDASDALAARTITPEYEAQVPFRDLLSARERAAAGWDKSPGIQMNWAGNNELEIVGIPVEKGKVTGVASAIPATHWQDVIIDIGFTIMAGEVDLFLRYLPNRKFYTLTMKPGDGSIELNKAVNFTIHIKGSDFQLIPGDGSSPHAGKIDLNVGRAGGIGFALNEGSRIIISTLKVKVLRPRT